MHCVTNKRKRLPLTNTTRNVRPHVPISYVESPLLPNDYHPDAWKYEHIEIHLKQSSALSVVFRMLCKKLVRSNAAVYVWYHPRSDNIRLSNEICTRALIYWHRVLPECEDLNYENLVRIFVGCVILSTCTITHVPDMESMLSYLHSRVKIRDKNETLRILNVFLLEKVRKCFVLPNEPSRIFKQVSDFSFEDTKISCDVKYVDIQTYMLDMKTIGIHHFGRGGRNTVVQHTLECDSPMARRASCHSQTKIVVKSALVQDDEHESCDLEQYCNLMPFLREVFILQMLSLRDIGIPTVVDMQLRCFPRKFEYRLALPFHGTALYDGIRKGLRVPSPTVIDYILQILRTLVECHAENIAHADIKPQNVVVERGRTTVIDFNSAILGDMKSDLQPESVQAVCECDVTTYQFCPPEIFPFEGKRDYLGRVIDYAKVDVYSVGITAVEIFTGGKISMGNSLENMTRQTWKERHKHFQKCIEEDMILCKSVRTLLLRMISENIRDRPTAKESVQIIQNSH
jgi:hypothetical protein